MRILVIGKSGQLASEFAQMECPQDWQLRCVGRPEIDITKLDTIFRFSNEYQPHVIINTAAYTAVDKAESEQEQAFMVNATGAGNVARVARMMNIPCLHFSTDYVFNGKSSRPYQESDEVDPVGVYGRSKEAGESIVRAETDQHIILRTSWLYSSYKNNFVKTMLGLMSAGKDVKVVSDQLGSPSSTQDLALAVKKIIPQLTNKEKPYGTYHISGSGVTNWYEFAMTIQQTVDSLSNSSWSGGKCKITSISTAEYQCEAPRPAYSVLDNSKLVKVFGLSLPAWEESLLNCIKRIYSE